jgi:hypothetical protein
LITPSNSTNKERIMSFKTIAAAAAVSLCVVPLANAQGLTGSTVTGALYCCNAPTEENRATNFVTATVGSQVEFPNGAFTSMTPGLSPVPATLDIGANTIDLHYLASAPAAPGMFDGYVLSFAGAPSITSVTADPSSTLTPASLSFTASTVLINNAGLALTPQSRLLLNVTAVPEPAQVTLTLAGLAAVTWFARRRRQRRI